MFVDVLADRNLFVTCTAGMCNRLLLLAGAMRIAEITGRKLFQRWSTNGEAGGQFNDFFTNPIAPLTEAELLAMLKHDRRVVVYNGSPDDELHFRAMRRHGDPEAHVVIIKGWDTPLFEGESVRDAESATLKHLRSLQPVAEVSNEVDRFVLPQQVIGVHVRRGDHAEWFGGSSNEDFTTIMRAVLEHAPETKFLFSTDELATESVFRREFGDALICYPKTFASRATIHGLREALVELFLLSRTSAIIGNDKSSFSMMAARYGGKPLIIANEHSSAAVKLFALKKL